LNYLGVIYQPALFLLTIMASITATIGCSTITYRYIELPAINFGHWLTKKIQQRFQQ
jgi:peptidoglycan/LPS O-acetylase OafA/YrhL